MFLCSFLCIFAKPKEHLQMKDSCYHCGDPIESPVEHDQHRFCCTGCSLVYQLLHQQGLSDFYTLNPQAGTKPKDTNFDYLDDLLIVEQLLDFQDEQFSSVELSLPSIHCSSCIYLLEQLPQIKEGIQNIRVNFFKKNARILFKHGSISLHELILFLSSLGYTPNLSDKGQSSKKKKSLLDYKLGLAFFVFGNVMLYSLPEYIDSQDPLLIEITPFLRYINMLLCLILYIPSKHYFTSSWNALTQRKINTDLLIAVGITTLFIRSAIETILLDLSGYWDSLAGLIFFLSSGQWIQTKVFAHLNFDNKIDSFFPLATQVKTSSGLESVLIKDLEPKQHIYIKQGDIIPCDSVLIEPQTVQLDQSFITGEQYAITLHQDDHVYAGSKLVSPSATLEVQKSASQSYLTDLWIQADQHKVHSTQIQTITDYISRYFAIVIFVLATSSATYWGYTHSWQKAIEVASSILIIACPCALALSVPYTYGAILRLMAKRGIYLKHFNILDKLTKLKHLVFDKTGTLTKADKHSVQWHGDPLDPLSTSHISKLCSLSNHPLSIAIHQQLGISSASEPTTYQDHQGQGIEATIDLHSYKIGSASWVKCPDLHLSSTVYISKDSAYLGHFTLHSSTRSGLSETLEALQPAYDLHLISGDKDTDRKHFASWFEAEHMHFQQTPEDKARYINQLKNSGQHVAMIGDGLNDSIALIQSDIAIAVSEKNQFSPSADIIIEGDRLDKLALLLTLAIKGRQVIYLAITLSFLYNIVGLSFALMGMLSPLVSAILMPLSSVSVIALTLLGVYFQFRGSRG